MNKKKLIRKMESIVGKGNVVHSPTGLTVYEYDASLHRGLPDAVAFATSTQQVSRLVKFASSASIPFLPRGSGTNLSGGTVPAKGGIVIELSRMNNILEIDLKNQRALVEPGVYNQTLQDALAPLGYFYAPDPASQKVSTIGGNVGENSGGPLCLKYGVTTNHVLGLEFVLPDGKIVQMGGNALNYPGYDLKGVVVGSEGTLGIATKITVRIMRLAEEVKTFLAIYDSVEDAGQTVSDIIAAGIMPAALEMMDKLVLKAVEESVHAGYPLDAEAVLIIELDGLAEDMDHAVQRIIEVCKKNRVREIEVAASNAERDMLWVGRRGAFGAVGRLYPSYMVNDGTVPRAKLPQVLKQVAEIGKKYGVPIGNVLHAGDGNLHPLIFFDERDKDQVELVKRASHEILQACVDVGGTISGEHGIGIEKLQAMWFLFGWKDLNAMWKVKRTFDPKNLCNPGKALPEIETKKDQLHVLEKKIRTRLIEIVGKAGLKEGEAVKGYSIDSLLPQAVLFPRNTEEVEQIVTLALEEGLTIIPWGGGSQMGLGALPSHVDFVVCLNHLDRILDQDNENMSITAEAGIRLGTIQESLRHVGPGFFIPLDPPCAEEVTLGGAVATDTSGPSRFLHGTLRDLVLGIEAVIPQETGKGQKTHVGGKTVKNVSGYDMSKLYIGSLGTLAIIVGVTCRILPLPEDRATVVAGFPRSEAPWACAQALLESQLLPTSIEVYNRETTSLFFKHATPSAKEEAWAAIGLQGIKEGVEREIQEIEKLMRSEGATKFSILRGSKEVDHWKQMGRLGLNIRNTGARSIGLKVSVPISMAQKISNTIAEEGVKINIPFYQLSHAGSGIVYAHIPLSEVLYKERKETLTQIVNSLREQVLEMGGSLVVEYAPPTFKERVDVWGEIEGVFPIMECLKKEFDPGNILNAGRYVGGI